MNGTKLRSRLFFFNSSDFFRNKRGPLTVITKNIFKFQINLAHWKNIWSTVVGTRGWHNVHLNFKYGFMTTDHAV